MLSTENSVNCLYKTISKKVMTEFSNEQVECLIKLFQEELGLKVSREEACQHTTQLVELLRIAFRDVPDTSSPP